jgi:hypothetical protein
MNKIQIRNVAIYAALAALMAATRFEHFGSAISLPDASYAVFFLGGLYMARSVRASAAVFAALIIEAGLIDFYATSVQGISDWCMTPAYWFLIPTYGSLWFVGRWFALHSHSADETTSHSTRPSKSDSQVAGYKLPKDGDTSRWLALRHEMEGRGLIGLALAAWAGCSFAFVFSNATFYLFSERFASMTAIEYASRVAQYYGSYVMFALLYIACALATHMAFDIIARQRAQARSEAA